MAETTQTPLPTYQPCHADVSQPEIPDRDAAILEYFEHRLLLVEVEAAELRRLLRILRQKWF